MADKRPGQNLFALLILVLTAAVLLAAYLTMRHTLLATQQTTAGSGLCSFSAEYDCDSVLLTPEALVFGIPNSLYGLTLYSSLLLAGLVAWYARGRLWKWYIRLGLLADLAAVSVSVYLAYVLLTRMPSRCVFCIALQICSLLALVIYFGLLRTTRDVEPRPREPGLACLTVLLCVFLAAIEFFSMEQYRLQGRVTNLQQENALLGRIKLDPGFNMYLYEQSPKVDIPIDPETPMRGRQDAKHTLVLFADFQCGPCSRFHHVAAEAANAMSGKVKVYFKHFPLGKACNPVAITEGYHPLSCDAAYAAEAARLQGKFWEYADLLYGRQDEMSPGLFEKTARDLNLDMEKFHRDRQSEKVRNRVKEDIALGNELRLTATPSVFLNGRALEGNELRPMFFSLIRAFETPFRVIRPGEGSSLLSATQEIEAPPANP